MLNDESGALLEYSKLAAWDAQGQALITITNGQGVVAAQTVTIARVAPAVFTLNASGRGLPAAVALRSSGGSEPIARLNPVTNQYEAIPIDLGPATETVFLVMFGTGFRFVSAQAAATATIGGTNAPVSFAGVQGSLVGVDQANISIPRSLIGRGDVDVVLMIDGQVANTVRVNIK